MNIIYYFCIALILITVAALIIFLIISLILNIIDRIDDMKHKHFR